MPPLKIQEAFIEWVKKIPPRFEVKVYPEELFLILRDSMSTHRIYHSYSPTNPTLAPKDQIFPRVAHAEFIDSVTDENHKYEPFAIHYLDEAEKEEDANSITVRFDNIDHNIIVFGTNIWFVLRKRTLYVEDLEHVSAVRFTEEDKKQDFFALDLHKEYDISEFQSGTVDDDENRVLIQHQGRGLIDKVLIPRDRKDEEIIAKLFEEDDLLNDPFSAPTSLDISWRFADIRGLTGIRWEIEAIPLENISTPTDKLELRMRVLFN